MGTGFIIVRWVFLVISWMLAAAVLGLAANVTRLLHNRHTYFPIEGLSLATSSLTVLTIPILLIATLFASGMAMMGVELVWVFILWALWLSTAALADRTRVVHFHGGCGRFIAGSHTICQQLKAVEAISYVTWILLMIYDIALLANAIVGEDEQPTSRPAVREEKPPQPATSPPAATAA